MDERMLKDLRKSAKELAPRDFPGFVLVGEERRYDLEPDWDVVVHFEQVDGISTGILNGVAVMDCYFGESKTVSLKQLLVDGMNVLEIQAHNVSRHAWSLRYVIGIFDAHGNLQLPVIDNTVQGKEQHPAPKHTDVFHFNKRPKL